VSVTLTVLGSGDAFGTGGRFQTCLALRGGPATILIDCGASSLIAMKRFGVAPGDVAAVVVSHLHGDHFGGLPFLLLEYIYESPRTRPLTVLGPPGLRDRTWMLMRALYPDVLPEKLAFRFDFVELEPEKLATIADVTIHPVRVPHQDEDVSLALGFTSGGKRFLYSGDSPWDERFVELARDVDLFLCECTAYTEPMGRHIQWATLQTHLPRLACRRLVLIHLGRTMREHCGELGVECATEGMKLSC
jgi:ribonuclease BN (tRNA processing enzyme)